MKKGFTLVELLAVLVILAIVALIAVPIVLNLISSSKQSANERSAELYIDAVEKALIEKNLEGRFEPTECTIENSVITCDGETLDVVIKGQAPVSGTILLKNSTVQPGTILHFQDYTAELNSNNKILLSKALPCSIVSGNVNTIGSEVACGDEHFYITSTDQENNTVTMITKWFVETKTNSPKQTQDYESNKTIYSNSAYWYDSANNSVISSNQALDYTEYEWIYAYDKNNQECIICNYIEAYKTYLISLGINVSEARLISYKEYKEIQSGSQKKWPLPPIPEGTTITNYWLGNAKNDKVVYIWYRYNYGININAHEYNDYAGIRPVITIPMSNIM